jgi:hypothetical protein
MNIVRRWTWVVSFIGFVLMQIMMFVGYTPTLTTPESRVLAGQLNWILFVVLVMTAEYVWTDQSGARREG